MPISHTLYFAGEATESSLAATVVGAVKSGYRAADEVIDYLTGSIRPLDAHNQAAVGPTARLSRGRCRMHRV